MKGLPNPNFDQKNILSFYANNDFNENAMNKMGLIQSSIELAYFLATGTNFLGETYCSDREIVKQNKLVALAAALARCDTIFEENFFYVRIFCTKYIYFTFVKNLKLYFYIIYNFFIIVYSL